MSLLLNVLNQSMKDSVGQPGHYSGQVNVKSGLPHGKGSMDYSGDNAIAKYEGDWNEGYWEGQGTCHLDNGDLYKGEFVHHERHGNGEYSWAVVEGQKERLYQGMFFHNQRHGHGKYTWKTIITNKDSRTEQLDESKNETEEMDPQISISTYVGSFHNGQRQGHGVYTSPAVKYAGEWKGGVYDGYGVLEVPERTYKGYFQGGHKHGHGIESKKDGTIIYDGQWIRDQPAPITVKQPTTSTITKITTNSSSPSTTPTKSAFQHVNPTTTIVLKDPEAVVDGQGRSGMYKGILQDNLPQGVGTMTYAQHPGLMLEYEGFWQQGMKHGFGRASYMSGDSYKGDFFQNVRQGKGELIMADGRHYKGSFYRDLPNGEIRVVYPKNDIFLGQYEKGQRHGKGKFVWSDGGYFDGEWKEGTYDGSDCELVTSLTMYKGAFVGGLYHGFGHLINLETEETIYEGEFDEGLPVNDKLEEISNLLLQIPQAPMDYDVLTSTKVDVTPNPAPTTPSKGSFSSILGGISSLMTESPPPRISSPLPTTASIETTKQIHDTDENDSTYLDKTACKAVVDMSVVDGQDNPGHYTGIIHIASQQPHGVGRMVYDDGNRVHEGFWEYGHRQGHGRCLFVQIGDFHEGSYHENLRHGPGTYYWKDGRQFSGIYHRDERQGEGKFVYPNGDTYNGNFERGQRSGNGTFTFHHKTCQYKGAWESGMYNGHGVLNWHSTRETQDNKIITAHRFEGNFSNGLFDGEGVEYENDQIVRQGLWKKGKFLVDEDESETNQDQDDDAPIDDQIEEEEGNDEENKETIEQEEEDVQEYPSDKSIDAKEDQDDHQKQ